MSLLFRLLSLVGLALIPALAVLVWGAREAGRAQEAAAREDALRLARLVAADHRQLADGARQLLTSLGNLRVVRALDEAECQAFFRRIMGDFPRYVLLATATLDGEVVCSAQPGARGNNIADREYFRAAVRERGFVVGGFVLGRASGQSSFHFAQPFYDNEGRMAGVVHAAVGLDWLGRQIARIPLPPNTLLSIVDSEGTVLAARPEGAEEVGKPAAGAVRNFLGRRSAGVEEGMGADGVHRSFAYIPAEVTGTHLVALGFDDASMLDEALWVQRGGALVLLATTLLAIGLTVLGARRLVRDPVDRLLAAAARWRAGDTAARLPPDEGGGSEFGRLAAAFNAMAEAAEARERSLRESEAEFRAIFETAAVGVVGFDLPHFRIERVNGRLCEMLGRGEEALVGSDLFHHLLPTDSTADRGRLTALVAAGRSTSEHRVIRGDGTVLWLRVFASVSDWEGVTPLRAVALMQDVTEQRLGEEVNARLAAVVNSAADAIVSLSGEEGRILTWNGGAEALFGYTAAEAVGERADMLLPPDEAGAPLYRRAMSGETIRDHEALRVARNGERIPVAITVTRTMTEDGRVIGLSVILRDLRERRAADQQQRLLMREIDHRARNVMAVVRSLVQLSPKEDPKEFARAIEGRISAMARAHSLLARDRWEGVSLQELAEEELGAHRAGGAVLEGPAVVLKPDSVQPLSMVLHELVTNSAKYGALSRPGGRITLRWRVEALPGELVPGIAMVWTESGGPPLAAPPQRRGFGSRLIEITLRHQLHGTIERDWDAEGLVVRMRMGGGCIADLGPSAAPPPASAPGPASPGGALRGTQVLLVEDEVLVALEAADSLVAAGCQVLGPASTLREAMVLAGRTLQIDAAVLDVNLAGQDVTPLADMLAARGVPMLFATGYGEAPTGHGGAPVLTKPVPPGELVAAVRGILGQARVSA
ncbi:PAS domain S-box protein [Muricoccus pecuniae]|uniref:histidine kinase n=1 Tax=Muricoccus pecuniae TaxID=693023 RepID=A0A840YEL0_9PROT|nr:PAS domain S-box protein [Roseomonas pecuniae]MBB5692314.1 PAS domain S-box-containing protein [Roseomonas pecuniae]